MKYKVTFTRSILDDEEFARKNFPKHSLENALRLQCELELRENKNLAGIFTLGTVQTIGVQYIINAEFETDLSFDQFRAELQNTYDEYGMSGHFNIVKELGKL